MLEDQRIQFPTGVLAGENPTPETPRASLIAATDEALAAFEQALTTMDRESDGAVFGTVKQVVLALNVVNAAHGTYDTIDREELCEYIDEALVNAGVDIEALAARHGISRGEITDRWRDW